MISDTVLLRGMTWDHDRGYNPMLVTSHLFSEKKQEIDGQNVFISWGKRSLQAFADRPLEQMTKDFDLIVIDHPHVGQISTSGILHDFNDVRYKNELKLLSEQSLSHSHSSYEFNQQQWALAIDAAAPVSAYRPDLLESPPKKWDDVIKLAERGKVLWPLIPINALMSYYNFLANVGEPFGEGKSGFGVDKKTSIEVLKLMKVVSDKVPSLCFSMDPIDAYEWLSIRSTYSYVPFLYGYSNYSRKYYRPHLIKVANIPSIGNDYIGSPIGGTGIAISKSCQHLDIALEYSFWIASAECQKSVFYESGGQPANLVAWYDKKCNEDSHDFFSDTLQTLKQSYLRPRHRGYTEFQDTGGNIIYKYLTNKISAEDATDCINEEYNNSFK